MINEWGVSARNDMNDVEPENDDSSYDAPHNDHDDVMQVEAVVDIDDGGVREEDDDDDSQ